MSRASVVPSLHRSVLLLALLAARLPAVLQAQAAPEPATSHKGLFLTLGVGYGSVECSDCSGEGGVSPMFEVGGWLSPTLQLGFGAHASIGGGDGVASAGPVLTVYVEKASRIYFTALAGVAAEFTESIYLGFGGSATVGYELPISRSLALAPYVGVDFRTIGEEGFTGVSVGVALRLP